MNSIEISHLDRDKFLTYIADCLSDQPGQQQLGHDIKNFSINIDSDDRSVILPSHGEFHWQHEGETFVITYHEEGKPVTGSHSPQYFSRFKVQHPNVSILKDFVTKALTFSKPVDQKKIKIFVGKVRGYWEAFQTIYAQPIDMIFMDKAIKSSITSHIDTFLASQKKHIKYGRPYKLNFLFTGVPGSGKSSLVKALAMNYERPLYIMGFSKCMTDENLVDLISEIKDNSILLLEDIDAFFMDRKAVDVNVSFSCLLNILDGTLNRGNGVITIMTANNPERLDPALIRPGRVDRIIRFDYPKRADIESAFVELTENSGGFEEFYKRIKNVRISMSGIIDYLFRHPTDYMESIDELLNTTQLLQEILNDKTEKMYT